MGYTVEKIESVAEKFRNLPPAPDNKKREVSKQETVKMLKAEIATLQQRGYSIEQIAELMRGEGLDFATPVLRSYLQRTKLKRDKKTKTKREPKVVASEKKKDTPPAAPPNKQRSDSLRATFTAKPDTRDI